MAKLSEQLKAAKTLIAKEGLIFDDLFQGLSVNGHMLPAVFCCIPFLLPIPLPGISTVLGVLVMIFGGAMLLSVPPYIPSKLRKTKLQSKMAINVFSRLESLSRKFETLFRPRWLFVSKHPLNYQFNGLVISICGLILALPLPPGTNLPPAINILILAIADIEDDGLLIVVGYAIFALMISGLVGVLYFGVQLF